MCVVSMVGDHYTQKWELPEWNDMFRKLTNPQQNPFQKQPDYQNSITRQEFDSLKKEVEDMKKLLQRAVEYDAKNNEPHCEMESKVALLKEVAKLVGVDLSDVFKRPTTNTSTENAKNELK